MPTILKQVEVPVSPEEIGNLLGRMDSWSQVHAINALAKTVNIFANPSMQLEAITHPHDEGAPKLTEQAKGMILMLADMIREG